MSNLKLLVENIVTDLVEARFEADLRAAELAELYRDNENLRALNIPTLNIKNVSIDLRFVFEDTPLEPAEGPSDEQVHAVADAAQAVSAKLAELSTVKRKVTTARSRMALSRELQEALNSTALDKIDIKSADRTAAVEKEVTNVLAQHGITKLSSANRAAMLEQIANLENALARAPKPKPRGLPAVLVGAKALSKADPNLVSTIHFEVDLSERRWREVSDDDGPRSVLVED